MGDKQAGGQAGRQAGGQAGRQAGRRAGRQAGGQAGRQAGRRWVDDRHTGRVRQEVGGWVGVDAAWMMACMPTSTSGTRDSSVTYSTHSLNASCSGAMPGTRSDTLSNAARSAR